VKKFLSIFLTLLIAFVAFAFITKNAEADKSFFGIKSPGDIERVKQISLDYLTANTASRSINAASDIKVQSVEFDELNMAHTKVRQTVGDVPVWEGEAIVHLKADGSLSTITDNLKDALVIDTKPNISSEEAVEIAQKMYNGGARLTEQPKVNLWIYRGEFRDHLAYRIEMPRLDGTEHTSVPVIFVDAQTGEKVFEYDNLQTGSGNSLYSGTINIDTSVSGSTYYMEDLTRKMGTFNMNNTGNTTTGTGGTQSRYTGTDDVWSATNERAGVDAHYGAAKTFDYFKNVHGRNGINGSGGPGTTTAAANSSISLIASRVHFGSGYNNAFWYNNQMTYGDGDGTSFTPLVSLDIAGHEMTHGVTQFSANLTYANESGALNESMSDVFGAMVESYARGGVVDGDTWKIGEQCYTPKHCGRRSPLYGQSARSGKLRLHH
jgi:Zn-dependent metalloprotease